ncbi:VOC family protein [Mycobacteroides abscessus]|nr:VOC family protein [Mycobacteroides abscessus]MDM2424623.1 VOC family protein [Mycobacteroides abscessus]MDM2429855.1 VOC family protein [Mycobacteroides abscessus]MDM2434177.1 VOC family protein [Mycobacteroides abscessus]MDM2442784.1 VOC family protein [Mycobacteroides abscessus]
MARRQQVDHAVIPHLTVDNCAEAIEFYKKAFGAVVDCIYTLPDGRVIESQFQLNGNWLSVNDPIPERGDNREATPRSLGGTPVTIHLDVPEPDVAFGRAVEAGAEVVFPMDYVFWGDRYGIVKDPWGHQWAFGQRTGREVSQEEIEKAISGLVRGAE